jgi:hypothetical protein
MAQEDNGLVAAAPQKLTDRRPTQRELRATYQLYAPRRGGGWRQIGDVVKDIITNLEADARER